MLKSRADLLTNFCTTMHFTKMSIKVNGFVHLTLVTKDGQSAKYELLPGDSVSFLADNVSYLKLESVIDSPVKSLSK